MLDLQPGKTKTGYLWALTGADRDWGGGDPSAVAFIYAPCRQSVAWASEKANQPIATSGILEGTQTHFTFRPRTAAGGGANPCG